MPSGPEFDVGTGTLVTQIALLDARLTLLETPPGAADVGVAGGAALTAVCVYPTAIIAGYSRQLSIVVEGWEIGLPATGGCASWAMVELFNSGAVVFNPATLFPAENNLPSGWETTLEIVGTDLVVKAKPGANASRWTVRIISLAPPRQRSTVPL